MINYKGGKKIGLVLVSFFMLLTIVGCSSPTSSTNENDLKQVASETEAPVYFEEEPKIDDGLTDEQRNSLAMLNFLAVTSDKVRNTDNSRLLLDDILTSLINNINPQSIDERTQEYLAELRDIIYSLSAVDVKKERVDYLHNQYKAQQMMNVAPNPASLLAATNPAGLKALALSTALTAYDSFQAYNDGSSDAEKDYILNGWDLEDEEKALLYQSRTTAFDYMVDIVRESGIEGNITLTEKMITDFNKICATESVVSRIESLKSNEETYKYLGDYWIELASAYYENGQYEECLKAIDSYKKLSISIFRKDYKYASVLPEGIASAQEVYKDDKTNYIRVIDTLNRDLVENTDNDDWASRYFAAQTNIDLFMQTQEKSYLETAYELAFDNVVNLVEKQKSINSTYIDDIKEPSFTKIDTSNLSGDKKKKAEEKNSTGEKALKAFVKYLKDLRKKELPTEYEPLVLNCDLLFALANELEVSDEEKTKIERILGTDSNSTFISDLSNQYYSFSNQAKDYDISLSKKEIVIPVSLLTDKTQIKVTVSDGSNSVVLDDCAISEVDRKNKSIDSFTAVVSSKTWKKYDWTENTKVTIELIEENISRTFNFKVKEYKKNIIGDKVEFSEV